MNELNFPGNLLFVCRGISERLFKWRAIALPVSLCLVLLFNGCKKEGYAKVTEVDAEGELAQMSQEGVVKRGAYLVTTIGCADCHSPKQFGEQGPEAVKGRELSGFQEGQQLPEASPDALQKGWVLMSPDLTAAVGPWGTSFAANITSDETGIGSWTEEQFKTAMRKGKFKGL